MKAVLKDWDGSGSKVINGSDLSLGGRPCAPGPGLGVSQADVDRDGDGGEGDAMVAGTGLGGIGEGSFQRCNLI